MMTTLSLSNTALGMEFATREAREATFVPPTKRSKSGWPHKTPTAAELSKAGFYYKPSTHSNDNTVCFLCDRNLDGWEPNDNPIEEHLKHAEDCGWARLMSIEAENGFDTSNMEDPTGQQLVDARKATFAIGWPHEGKRGWTCKTEKMVEAGWYFAPTTGSEDYVSCAYCKLSLDGWEPKDNPFEEHYSRSPSCPFFVFAGTTAPSKRPKAKKGRASRASRTSKVSTRLSTQSNATLQSEAPSIPDLDESIDTSAISILSTASTATTKAKRKAGNSKTKTTKSKRTKATKSKKPDESEQDATLETSQETLSEEVTYPKLEIETQRPVREELTPIPVVEPTIEDDIAHAMNNELPTGPPQLPSPKIPVLIESPVPASSQRSEKRMSSARSASRNQPRVSTPPPRSSPSQPSDVENAPPSARPESDRPPLSSPGAIPPQWTAVDADIVFESIAGSSILEKDISEQERQMTVEKWIKNLAEKAESELRAEGERVVGIFEKEGQRALTVLEGITCI